MNTKPKNYSYTSDILTGIIFALVAVMLFAFAADAKAAACQPIRSDLFVTLKWIPPTQREDNTALPASEIKSYTIDKKNTVNNVACQLSVPATDPNQKQVEVVPNVDYDFRMSTTALGYQLDKNGNKVPGTETTITGKYSPPLRLRIEAEAIQQPAAVSDLVITKVTGLNYSFNFSPVTKFKDGSDLPKGAVRKYYLFEQQQDSTGKWLQDILPANIPFQRTLTAGIHQYNLETEIAIAGQTSVSARSQTIQLDTNDGTVITLPPKPVLFEVIVPEGYKAVITVIPQ